MATNTNTTTQPPPRIPYFRQIFDHCGITPSVSSHAYTGSGTPSDPYVVVWIENDPRNPMLYSFWTRWGIAAIMGIECLGVTFCSSVYTGGVGDIIEEFGCGRTVAILGLSLYVLGFAIGPLVWAPLSEMYGRQYVHIVSFFGLTAFNAGAAGAQNIWTLIILRFLAGSVGSSALVSSGAVLADIFRGRDRGLASSIFSLSPWLGPVLGPVIGGFVGESIGWRWLHGIMAMFTAAIWLAGTFLVPETYAPILLRRRAAKLSQITGAVYQSRGDIEQERTFRHVLQTNLLRPWIMLFTEPIVFVLSIYTAIVYGTLYMFFGAYPIVYQEKRGWSQGVGGLAFLGILVGMILAIVPFCVLFQQWYAKQSDKHKGLLPPETRLLVCMAGALAAPIGLFWFAWTNGPSVHFMVSITAGGVFGFGLVTVFSGCIAYLVDSYTIYAASVLAANSVLRSVFGAAFPLFTTQMFHNLGIHWASTIPAFLSLACLPFPFLLYKYGPAIRSRCKYAAKSAAFMARIQGGPAPSKSTMSAEDDKGEGKEMV